MAFHLACPLTCRKICYCTFGDPSPAAAVRKTSSLLQQKIPTKDIWPSLEHLLEGAEKTVDVIVPCLLKDVKKNSNNNKQRIPAEEGTPATKRAFRGKKMSLGRTKDVVEVTPNSEHRNHHKKVSSSSRLTVVRRSTDGNNDVTRSERGGGASNRTAELGGAHGHNNNRPEEGGAKELREPLQQAVCGMCSSVEIVGGEREKRMLSCRSCSKKYHRKCVKRWAEFRDLFDWTSWVCGSCRSCEVCRQTGDANKLTFCKRCDEGLHIYCQQPPLKHLPKGPYLCPKHTLCHSCGSSVPGSGVSSRWFLSYTNCDACGRLFVKEKYCPVCLKVYRDSEVTPMVCCDSCEHWVHCWCDGISDEQFYRYQNDDNLRYVCAACRGDCHKVESVEDAVLELWRRRDENDAEQRSKIAAAAGLPSPEEMQEFIPSSEDEKPSGSRGFGHQSRPGRTQTGRFATDNGAAFTPGRDKQEGSGRKKIIVRNNSKMMSSNSRALGGPPVRPKSFMASS